MYLKKFEIKLIDHSTRRKFCAYIHIYSGRVMEWVERDNDEQAYIQWLVEHGRKEMRLKHGVMNFIKTRHAEEYGALEEYQLLKVKCKREDEAINLSFQSTGMQTEAERRTSRLTEAERRTTGLSEAERRSIGLGEAERRSIGLGEAERRSIGLGEAEGRMSDRRTLGLSEAERRSIREMERTMGLNPSNLRGGEDKRMKLVKCIECKIMKFSRGQYPANLIDMHNYTYANRHYFLLETDEMADINSFTELADSFEVPYMRAELTMSNRNISAANAARSSGQDINISASNVPGSNIGTSNIAASNIGASNIAASNIGASNITASASRNAATSGIVATGGIHSQRNNQSSVAKSNVASTAKNNRSVNNSASAIKSQAGGTGSLSQSKINDDKYLKYKLKHEEDKKIIDELRRNVDNMKRR